MTLYTNSEARITILGTSHIAQQSIQDIQQQLHAINPDIIAVELDRQRLHGLLSNQKPSLDIRILPQVGVKGYLFAVIGAFLQKKLGGLVDVSPGADMKFASQQAMQAKKTLVLIDQPIIVTLKRFSQTFTWKERGRLFWDLLTGWRKKQRVVIPLTTVPGQDLVTMLLKQVKGRYPSLYNVFVHERDVYMAKQLVAVRKKFPEHSVFAVVGEGHMQGLTQELEKLIKQEHANNIQPQQNS